MTTRVRSASVSKGLPVNYCSGFRSVNSESAIEVDGLSTYIILILISSYINMSNYKFNGTIVIFIRFKEQYSPNQ